ncbi:hypothetical protein FBU59_002788 [Linderina macrospora]|uniref:Uncharacterized protein n=1 Tax=Linderina macrospora TaxID=4868 RepID=A0ACC1JA66_9FUNG|nr:hypothetical protein FBU59_002788 [Linderina macrospora]
MVGTSILDYSTDPHAKHYSCQWPADNPEIGVVLLPCTVRHRNGTSIFAHALCINCSGHIFSVITAFPELGNIELGQSILYKLQFEADFEGHSSDTASIRTVDSGSAQQRVGVGEAAASGVPEQCSDLVNLEYPVVTKETLRNAHVHTARSCRAKACFVLSRPAANVETHGPTVVFVTNSINRVLGSETEGHEVINMAFFALIAPSDITKAARFLESLVADLKPQVCVLEMLQNPNSGRPRGSADPETIKVELLGAISDDGVVLLCQKVRDQRQTQSGADDELGYMSLSEIISSDPDSSDFPEEWSRFMTF